MATGQHSDHGHLAQPNVVLEVRPELEPVATQLQPTVEVIVLVPLLKADDVEQPSVRPIFSLFLVYTSNLINQNRQKIKNKLRTILTSELKTHL